jgi:uncharacterized membrane protein YtjA (UPF0391 family)
MGLAPFETQQPVDPRGDRRARRIIIMGEALHYAIVFLVIALIAAFFGFGGVAGFAMQGAQLLFWVALVLLIVSVVVGAIRRV